MVNTDHSKLHTMTKWSFRASCWVTADMPKSDGQDRHYSYGLLFCATRRSPRDQNIAFFSWVLATGLRRSEIQRCSGEEARVPKPVERGIAARLAILLAVASGGS